MTPQFLAIEVLNGLQYGMLLLLVTVAVGVLGLVVSLLVVFFT